MIEATFMIRKAFLLPFSFALLVAGNQPWLDKTIPDWNDDDIHLILNDSPWTKTVQPDVEKAAGTGARQSRGIGRGGGINLGGIGIGVPGMGGMGPRGGGGGGGYPGSSGGSNDIGEPPVLHLRWESALPIRAAEMKAHEANTPTVDEDHYAIAVYGVPDRLLSGAAQGLESQLKKEASIRRNGKSDFKPSGVNVLQRENGPLIVYLFPRSKEITRQDQRIEFDAKIGRLKLSQSFYPDDMIYQGKLEM